MGLDEHSSQTIHVSGSSNTQINAAGNKATINAAQNINPRIDELEPLLKELIHCAESTSAKDRELIQDSVQALRDELASGTPKTSVIRPVLAALKGISVSAQLAAAVAQLVSLFSAVL